MAGIEPRAQTWGEEVANGLSHGVGMLLAAASLPILVQFAARQGGTAELIGVRLFSATMIVLYLVSALYHAMPRGRAKHWLNRIDHAAIYLFIAGSYMPYLLGVLRGPWGWTLFGIVCSAAALGIAAKMAHRLRHPLWSTGPYLAMGSVALLAAVPLAERLSTGAIAWLVAGGVAYTLGAAVFLLDEKVRFAHFVWHLFVVAGSGCHVMAALRHPA
ncbi:MAG: hemolysin III family protein [Burkholderiaceae bacterium]|jgi:hemolysin III|nr:hemolysin III family protein [Burkholderiaceae bacterium]